MSKIAAIIAHPITMPLERPFRTAQELQRDVSLILVEIRTDDGLIGVGQIGNKPVKDICAWVERFAGLIAGMDALATTDIWEKLFRLTAPATDGSGGLSRNARPQIMAAIGGIDMALWDIKGKATGLPLHRLLGVGNRPVFAYATGGYYYEGDHLTACADELAGFIADGFTAVKLKTGGGVLADEVARVRATREAIGKDTLLMLDANAGYDLRGAIEFARAVEPYDITWFEEPLHWYLQPADFVRLAAAISIPLAHGERELTRFTARDYTTSGALRYMQFDATRSAGITEALRVGQMASDHGVLFVPHHAPELHCHLVAALPDAGYAVEAHGADDRDPIWHGIYLDRAEIRDSHVHMNDKPGFGCEIDWDFVRKHKS